MKVLVVVVMVLSEVMNESPLLFDPMTHPAPPRTTTAIGTGNSRVVGSSLPFFFHGHATQALESEPDGPRR